MDNLHDNIVNSLTNNYIVNVVDENNKLQSYYFNPIRKYKNVNLDSLYENVIINKKRNHFLLLPLKIIIYMISQIWIFALDFLGIIYLGQDIIDFISSTRNSKNMVVSKKFWTNISRHTRIHKNKKITRKIRIIYYAVIDDNSTQEHVNNILTLEALMSSGYVRNSRIVVYSNKIIFNKKVILVPVGDVEDSVFLNYYSVDILERINNGDYITALKLLNEALLNNQVIEVDNVNMMLQCLAFIKNKMSTYDFNNLMVTSGLLMANEYINTSIRNHIITETNDGSFVGFYEFVTFFLNKLYRKYSPFKIELIEKVILNLKKHDNLRSEFFLIFELSKKISHPQTLYNAIVANFYAENISNLNTEIEETNDFLNRCSNNQTINLYLHLKDESSSGTNIEVIEWLNIISNIDDNVVKLTFYYHLISFCYKNEIIVDFLPNYVIAINSMNSIIDISLSTLFKIQFILYMSVIENKKIIAKFEKTKYDYFQLIDTQLACFNNKTAISKMYRSSGGLFRSDYHTIYKYNIKAVAISSNNVLEICMSLNNLAAVEITIFKHKEARVHLNHALKYYRTLRNYKNIEITILGNKLIVDFLKAGKITQKISDEYDKLVTYSHQIEFKTCTEEFKHIFVNYLAMQVISTSDKSIYDKLLHQYSIVEDPYFRFYYFQVLVLYECLYSDLIKTPFIQELTVFFQNQKAYLLRKYSLLQTYAKLDQKNYEDLTLYLSAQLKSNSPIEKYLTLPYSYTVCERWFE